MRKIDDLYSFWLFGELEKINDQDHLGWDINGPDSPRILSKKNLTVEVHQQKSSTVDGRGSTCLVKG
jgi:hypothetical protein